MTIQTIDATFHYTGGGLILCMERILKSSKNKNSGFIPGYIFLVAALVQPRQVTGGISKNNLKDKKSREFRGRERRSEKKKNSILIYVIAI